MLKHVCPGRHEHKVAEYKESCTWARGGTNLPELATGPAPPAPRAIHRPADLRRHPPRPPASWPPVDGLDPDRGQRIERPLVIERHALLAALPEPDVAEVLQHRGQRGGGQYRIHARAIAVRLRRANGTGDPADRLAPQLKPPVAEPALDHRGLEDANQLAASLGVRPPEAGHRL